jgi:hypothetical protein
LQALVLSLADVPNQLRDQQARARMWAIASLLPALSRSFLPSDALQEVCGDDLRYRV